MEICDEIIFLSRAVCDEYISILTSEWEVNERQKDKKTCCGTLCYTYHQKCAELKKNGYKCETQF